MKSKNESPKISVKARICGVGGGGLFPCFEVFEARLNEVVWEENTQISSYTKASLLFLLVNIDVIIQGRESELIGRHFNIVHWPTYSIDVIASVALEPFHRHALAYVNASAQIHQAQDICESELIHSSVGFSGLGSRIFGKNV